MLLKCDTKLRRGEDYGKLFPSRLKHGDTVDSEDSTEVNNNTEDTLAAGKLKTDYRVTFSENITIGEVNDDSNNEKKDLVYEEEKKERQFQPCPQPSDHGKENPFLMGGPVWQDADLVIKMWKEGRITEVFTYEYKEDMKEENCGEEILDRKKKVIDKESPNNRENTTDNHRFKKNISSLCCSVM